MTRIRVVCEGKTELEFVKKRLAPYLYEKCNAEVEPQILCAKSGRHKGGGITVGRLAEHISREYHKTDRITTLVDFYGFKDRAGRTCEQLQNDIQKAIHDEMKRKGKSKRYDERFVLPYVQMHEFEGLLFSFSNPDVFACVKDGWNERSRAALLEVQHQFETPEDINDGADTAPSKRLEKIFGTRVYSKVEHGSLVAEKIGIETIRKKCPRFNAWVAQLAAWGT